MGRIRLSQGGVSWCFVHCPAGRSHHLYCPSPDTLVPSRLSPAFWDGNEVENGVGGGEGGLHLLTDTLIHGSLALSTLEERTGQPEVVVDLACSGGTSCPPWRRPSCHSQAAQGCGWGRTSGAVTGTSPWVFCSTKTFSGSTPKAHLGLSCIPPWATILPQSIPEPGSCPH